MLSGVRDFEFPPGIIGIVGPNGQGKSTLINSVAWAMFGAEALPLKARDPITWGAKQALVSVNLTLNDGNTWVVERTQKANLGKARLYMPDHDPKAEGSAPVTAAMTELLGVDREGFMISVFARQNELDRLRSMDPAPRMQTVLRLLGINQITKAVTLVRASSGEQRKALEALRGHQIDVEAVQEELEHLETEQARVGAEIASLEEGMGETNRLIAEQMAKRTELEGESKAYALFTNELQSRKATLALREASYQQAKVEAETPEPEKPTEPVYQKWIQQPSPRELDQLKNDYLHHRDQYINIKAEHDGLVTKVLDMKDTCPTCGRAFDDADHIEREKRRMEGMIASLAGEMEGIKAAGQRAKDWWDEGIKVQAEAARRDQVNASLKADFIMSLRQYELSVAHRAQAQNRMARASDALEQAQRAIEELKEVKDVSEEVAALRDSLDKLNVQLNVQTHQISTAKATLSYLNGEVKRVRAMLEGATKRADETKKLTKTVVQHETTATELQALKEKMIGQIIPSLNERASSLVEMMTDGKYSELSLTPDYEIEYRTHLGEYKNFLNLSGGEQTVFALALRLAISDLRAGNMGVMFLDEAISNLSSEDGRQESVWQAIESLTPRFQQIFVITHVEAYKDRAPYTVRL